MFKFELQSAEDRIEHLLDGAYQGIQRVDKLSTLLGNTSNPCTGLVSVYLQNKMNEANSKVDETFDEVKDVLMFLATKNI